MTRGYGLNLYDYYHSNPVIYYDSSEYAKKCKKPQTSAGGGNGNTKRIPPQQVNGGTFNVEVPPARRTGTGVVLGSHNANVRVLNSDGSTRNVWREVSRNATENNSATIRYQWRENGKTKYEVWQGGKKIIRRKN